MCTPVRLRLVMRAGTLGRRGLHDPPPSWGMHGWNGPPAKSEAPRVTPFFAAEIRATDAIMAGRFAVVGGGAVARESAVFAHVMEGVDIHGQVGAADIAAEDS
mmetsp:Transcript_22251/g.57156  ORF Transcript_22251/g.57156 Transcript_22251/m.57156 type:complete len:103 (-) Transcript_22251:349-657(-)